MHRCPQVSPARLITGVGGVGAVSSGQAGQQQPLPTLLSCHQGKPDTKKVSALLEEPPWPGHCQEQRISWGESRNTALGVSACASL